MSAHDDLARNLSAWGGGSACFRGPWCVHRYVLEHGERFEAAPLPQPFPYRRFRARSACFMNAGRLALEHPELTYVEGFGSWGVVPILHAWTVEPGGRVVDPTWPDAHEKGTVYLGVRFTVEDLNRGVLAVGCWDSLLERLVRPRRAPGLASSGGPHPRAPPFLVTTVGGRLECGQLRLVDGAHLAACFDGVSGWCVPPSRLRRSHLACDAKADVALSSPHSQ